MEAHRPEVDVQSGGITVLIPHSWTITAPWMINVPMALSVMSKLMIAFRTTSLSKIIDIVLICFRRIQVILGSSLKINCDFQNAGR